MISAQAAALRLSPLEESLSDDLHRRGVAKIRRALSSVTATKLLDEVLDDVTVYDEDKFSEGVFAQRAHPKAPKTRIELRLAMTAIVQSALHELLSAEIKIFYIFLISLFSGFRIPHLNSFPTN